MVRKKMEGKVHCLDSRRVRGEEKRNIQCFLWASTVDNANSSTPADRSARSLFDFSLHILFGSGTPRGLDGFVCSPFPYLWTVLEKIISLKASRSSLEYPPSWINFICLRIVDLPDSPAPVFFVE